MAITNQTLVPNYLDMDFATAKSLLQELLAKNPIYSQYRTNAEGNNITIMIELIAYLTQLCTYYINMVAKNNYISTSELYETTHMLARLAGYNPQGYRSSRCDLTVTLDVTAANLSDGTQLLIPSWKKIYCTDLSNPSTGDSIIFNNMVDTTATVSAGTVTLPITLSVREGIQRAFVYHGADIESDYRLYLPLEPYDYDDDIDDSIQTVSLYVNDFPWIRLSDFYENISGLINSMDVFMMKVDKYKRYFIEFSPDRNVPKNQDEISIILLKSSGVYGNVPSGSINLPEPQFVYDISNSTWIDNAYISVTNNDPSIGGADLESIREIKSNAIGTSHSQFRNVNREDYISFLENRSDIVKATVWGEQDIAPSGNTADYNKVYISVIPDLWGTNTISTTSGIISGTIVPLAYADDWKNTLMEYLEPKKILTTYEEWVLPELVYFSFIIGLKIRPNYTFAEVESDVIAKIQYYFDPTNRNFYDIVSYTDMTDFIMDTSLESSTNEFSGIRGLQVFTIRDVICDNTTIKEVGSTLYPQYMTDPSTAYDNRLRRIQLGYNQFPILNTIICEQEY